MTAPNLTLPTTAPYVGQGFGFDQRLRPWFFNYLAFALVGYAILGRPFAGIGVGPVYVGELALVLGVLAYTTLPIRAGLVGLLRCLPLLAFMAWGAYCTLPYLRVHGIDALRDAVLWGYGAFALLLVALLTNEPTRLVKVVDWFGSYARLFLMVGPFVVLGAMTVGPALPNMPLSGAPLLMAKGGDVAVQLAGVLTFAVMFGGLSTWLLMFGGLSLFGLCATGRSAMLSIFVGVFTCFVFLPRHKLIGRVILALATIVLVLWLTNAQLSLDGNRRDMNVESVAAGLWSIVGSSSVSDYDGTKTWRLLWWQEIADYTFNGANFWTGKGYGVNLADADGFQVEFDDNPLRAPHNIHMSVLGRSGVPGLALWVWVQGTFLVTIAFGWVNCRRGGHERFARLFVVLFAFWAAALVNATFDVYLEGPMGGVWFWCVYGLGIAAGQISRTHPGLLDNPQPSEIALQK